MKKLIYAFVALFTVTACNEGSENSQADTNVEAQEESTLDFYGENFDPTGAVSIEEMVTKMAGQESGDFVIKTKINETCAKMGCWMTVDQPEGEMMVYMKDHAFFVPKADAVGLDCYN